MTKKEFAHRIDGAVLFHLARPVRTCWRVRAGGRLEVCVRDFPIFTTHRLHFCNDIFAIPLQKSFV